MIVRVSIIIIAAAAVQWIIIRRIPSRLARVLLQVPLLIATFFGAWLTAQIFETQDTIEQQAAADARILDTMIVQRDDLIVTVNATGTITPLRQVPLTLQLAGIPVREIVHQQGERVDEGDAIAILDAQDLERAAEDAQLALNLQQSAFDTLTSPPREVDIASAEAALQAAQAQFNAAVQTAPGTEEVEIARLQTEIARNQLWQAQIQRDGIGAPPPLIIPGIVEDVVPEDTWEEIENRVQDFNADNESAANAQSRSADAAVDQLEYGVDIADLQLDSTQGRGADSGAVASANAQRTQARIALDQLLNGPDTLQMQLAALDVEATELAAEQAQSSLDEATLRAPFAGIIAQNNLTVGEIPPQDVSVILIDDSGYYVDLPIDETDIVNVVPEQRVTFEVDALPDANLIGSVESIAYIPVAIDQLVAYNTRVRLDVDGIPVRAGMTVTGSIIVQERDDVLLVRNNFVRFDRLSGDAFVQVRQADGSITEQMVLLGERNETFSEVQSGINEGDELVLTPRDSDEDGGLFGGGG